MHPVFLKEAGSSKGYSLDTFDRDFAATCESHRDEGRALAFAFIVYDFERPQIKKVLDDLDYWKALDLISGKYLTVFSFHIISRRKRSGNLKESKRTPPSKDPFSSPNRYLEKRFGIELPESQPLILFFQARNNSFSKPFIYELAADTIEDSFEEIKDALAKAVESVKNVRPEFRGNTEEIFDLIKAALGQRKLLRKVSRAMNWWERIKELIG